MLASIRNDCIIVAKSAASIVKRGSSILISLLLLAVLMSSAVYMIDLNKVKTIFFTMHPFWLSAAVILTMGTFLLNSYRFVLIARWILCEKAEYSKAVKVTWLGGFLSLCTPFAALGDVARAGLMKLVMRVSLRDSVEVILFDRGFGLFCLLWYALFSSLWCGQYLTQHWLWLADVIIPLGALAAMFVVLIVSYYLKWPEHRAFRYCKSLLDRLSYLLRQPRCVLEQMAITFFNLLIYVGSFLALSAAMNFSFDIVNLVMFSPLILIVNNLPFFYAGWGGREAALLMLVPMIAPTATNEVILAASMGYGVVFVLVSLMGGFYLITPNMLRNKFYGRA